METNIRRFASSLIIISLIICATFTPVVMACPAVTIGTSSTYNCTTTANMRKTFYANGRFWAFYSNGTDMVYRSSSDGLEWSDAVSVGACTFGHRGSVFFYGVYVHYTRYDSYNTYYRRGAPESDGSITWSADEQLVYEGDPETPEAYLVPMIAVDSNGFPWIGVAYRLVDTDLPKVVKSGKNNGTWEPEFEYTLNETWDPYWWVTIAPLTGGKVYVMYSRSNPVYGQFPILGRLYNGESWGSQEDDLGDYNPIHAYGFSASSKNDDVHLVYQAVHSPNYEYRYNRRVYGVGWQADDEVVTNTTTFEADPVISMDTLNDVVYCFWMTFDQTRERVSYKRRVTGTWDENATNWINEEGNPTDNVESITCFYKDYGGKIGVMYATQLMTPMNIRFDYLTLEVPEQYNLSLRVMDWDLTDPISGACTHVNSSQQTSDSNGWSNYTNLDSGTYFINVTWYGFLVNGTFSIELTNDTTLDVRCTLYDVHVQVNVVSGTPNYPYNVTTHNSTGNEMWQGLTNSTGYVYAPNQPNYTLTWKVWKNDLLKLSENHAVTSDEMNLTLEITEFSLVVVKPENVTYPSSTIPVELHAEGGTIDQRWYNVKNGTDWMYTSNQTYTAPTNMTGFIDGSYQFWGWGNNTDGDFDSDNVWFTVTIPSVTLTIIKPQNTTYTSSSIPVELSAEGGAIYEVWYNCKNGTEWIYAENQTYIEPINMLGFVNGAYTFFAWANNTEGSEDDQTVIFTVAIPPEEEVPPYYPPYITPTKKYSLTVHIVDLFKFNAPNLNIIIKDETGNIVATLTTDGNGLTTPVTLKAGQYTVEIYKDTLFQLFQLIKLEEDTTLQLQIGIPIVITWLHIAIFLLIIIAGVAAYGLKKRWK